MEGTPWGEAQKKIGTKYDHIKKGFSEPEMHEPSILPEMLLFQDL